MTSKTVDVPIYEIWSVSRDDMAEMGVRRPGAPESEPYDPSVDEEFVSLADYERLMAERDQLWAERDELRETLAHLARGSAVETTEHFANVLQTLQLKEGESFHVQVKEGCSEQFWYSLARAFEDRQAPAQEKGAIP